MIDEKGLTSAEAKNLLIKHGPNKLPEKPPPTPLQILIEQFKSPLVYVLLGAGLITVLLREFGDAIVIGSSVLINTTLGFLQENKANNSLQALKSLIHPTAKAIRDGEEKTIPITDVVPGDIAVLNTGDKVPADGVMIQTSHLFIEEAILTGESVPVSKDEKDKVFLGTIVTAGRGYMRVEVTGAQTEIGKIAEKVQNIEEETPLSRQLEAFSKQLTYLVIGLVGFVFVVGLFSGRELVEVFLTSVALAVSAIPEGLLVALTVVLAIGMQRILARKGLVRSLTSAETLGGVTTICSDKTGTLTEGKLRVVDVIGDKILLATQAILTNDKDDPIVLAAWDWGTDIVKNTKKLLLAHERLDELPFDAKDRFAATLNNFGSKNKILVNGAPEYLLEWSILSEKEKKEIKQKIEEYSEKGMRVLGMAEKTINSSKVAIHSSDVKNGKLTWNGLLAYSDPVRSGVKEALVKTKQAGIRLIVITGDYKKTALSVLRDLGVSIEAEFVIEGDDLRKMTSLDLGKILKNKQDILFARTTPEDKLKIVEALKSNGEIVAMTGDGVNDAPALARADIGVVVDSATDVAKESSDLVLLNSSFATIVDAVEEGRVIYDNIRKILLYLMSDAFEEIFLVCGVIIAGATFAKDLPLPITAAQVLYINIISDGFPNLALTLDPKRKESMQEPPRDPKEQLVTPWSRALIFIVSLTGGITAFYIFYINYYQFHDVEIARSVAFATLGVNSLVYVFSVRALKKPFWTVNFFNNKWLWFAVIGGFVVQLAPYFFRPLGNFFEIVPINLEEWIEVFAAAAIMFVVIEIMKIFYNRSNIK